MKHLRLTHFCSAFAAIGIALLATNASAQERTEEPIQLAQADCYATGQRVAAEKGGTLAKASAETSGGQTVCKIVVLVPGKGGERPRREEVTVPPR